MKYQKAHTGSLDGSRAKAPGVLAIAFACGLFLAPAAIAQDSDPAADTDDIQQIETAAEDRRQPAVLDPGLDFSLRSPSSEKSSDLFKLRDRKSVTTFSATNPLAALRRDAGLGNLISGASSPTVLENSSSLGLRFNADPQRPYTSGFEVALTSGLELRQSGLPGTEGLVTPGQASLMDRTYDLGLRLGYWGFRIDASVVRKDTLQSGAYTGYGLGIGYSSSRFDTTLSLKAFTEGEHLAGINEFDDSIHDIELGAAYKLSSRISVAGKVNYTRFNNRFLENRLGLSEQSVYLAGKLAF